MLETICIEPLVTWVPPHDPLVTWLPPLTPLVTWLPPLLSEFTHVSLRIRLYVKCVKKKKKRKTFEKNIMFSFPPGFFSQTIYKYSEWFLLNYHPQIQSQKDCCVFFQLRMTTAMPTYIGSREMFVLQSWWTYLIQWLSIKISGSYVRQQSLKCDHIKLPLFYAEF